MRNAPFKLLSDLTFTWARLSLVVIFFTVQIVADVVVAQDGAKLPIPDIAISVSGDAVGTSSAPLSASIKLVLLLTALTFAPALVLTMTSFTRIIIVLGMARTSLGTGSAPPNMVITGLAIFLTIAIMGPIFNKAYEDGVQPYLGGQMAEEQAFTKAIAPFRRFLIANARDKDIELFLEITKTPRPKDTLDLPLNVIVPAFVISELNSAFQIGFLIALPFLVLDMVVSSVLTSMSMITLPPVVISLPLKLMLFVIVDGWHLLVSSLVRTYTVTL